MKQIIICTVLQTKQNVRYKCIKTYKHDMEPNIMYYNILH
jgi:hypothetical protein